MNEKQRGKARIATMALAFLSALALVPTGRTDSQPRAKRAKTEAKMVHVCACLGTKSCACMTESKTEGPCSCGTEGGPPLKAVDKDSAWAKSNRDALAH